MVEYTLSEFFRPPVLNSDTKIGIKIHINKKPRTISHSGSDIGYYPMWGFGQNNEIIRLM
jgi:hypothetical protein